MSDFVEQITLGLDGNIVDGTATKGIADASEGLAQLKKYLLDLAASVISIAGLEKLVSDIYDATKAHENLTLTIAATMASTNDWSKSMGIASGQLEKLKESAALTGSTTGQMVETYTTLKRVFGGTSDEAVTLTNKLALLARQSGASVDELAMRLAAASITGTIMPRGAAGIALTGAGIDPQTLVTMKEAGQAMAYLNATIAEDPGLVEQLKSTWSYLGAEFSKTKDTALETIGQGLTPLKQAVKDMTDRMAGTETQAAFDQIGKNLRILNEQLLSLVPNTTGPSFFVGISASILKGFNVLLADLILIGKESLVAVDFMWDVLLNPDRYFSSGGKARLQSSLDAVVKIYQDNQVKISKINFGLAANILDTDAGSASTSPEKATAPGAGRAPKVKDNADAIAATIKDLWDQVNAYNQTGLAKEFALIDASTSKEIAAFTEKATTEKQVIDGTAAYKALAIAKEQALNQKSQAANDAEIEKQRKALVDNTDWAEAEQAKLYDQLGAVTDDYYEKQQANLNKADDAAHASIERRMNDGKLTEDEYAALSAAVQALYDAQTAKLLEEQNSIIGYRKTMEEAAASLVKTTDSIAGGIQAGLDKIQASVKSMTEIVRDYVVATWDTVTKGLDTVLLQFETGALNLKDAWKGIFNSLLQNFNSMVTDMVKRWLAGTDQMKGGSGGLGGLFAGAGQASSIDAQGNVVYHGGAIDMNSKGQGTQATRTQAQPQGLSTAGAIGVGALTALAGISAMSAADTVLGSGVSQAGIQIGMLVATYVNVLVGVIIAAIGVIVSALLPRQSEFTASYSGSQMALALKNGTAFGSAGSDTEKATTAALTISNSMTGFFADMFKNADPAVGASILTDLNKKIAAYFASLGDFGAHAGGGADFQADITKIFTEIIPKQVMHAMFGQTTNWLADPGGVTGAGLAPGGQWSAFGTSSFSKADPNSPLVGFLTSIGFTIAKVNEIAGQIDVQSAADFQKYFSGLVGVVMSANTLGKLLSQTYGETIAASDVTAAQSPAQAMAASFASVKGLLQAVSLYTGQEQITKGQEAIAAAQTFYDNAKAAMIQLAAMAKQVQTEAADSIKKVLDSLKTPAELFDENTASLEADYQRMRFASDPTTLMAAWEQARTDFAAIAADLVSRIQQIKSLLADMQTLQDAMASGPAIDATTNPGAWLAKNLADMNTYKAAMLAASPGSPEQIAAATSFAGLIRDRYQMEIDLLGRVKDAIKSITDSIDQQLFGMQVSNAATPKDAADLIYAKIKSDYGAIGTSTTPEQITALTTEIQGLATQLLGTVTKGTPGYTDAYQFVTDLLNSLKTASTGQLGKLGTAAQVDITTLGPQLQAAVTAMGDALTNDQTDLDALVFHFQSAANFVTSQMNLWGTQIADQLNALGPILAATAGLFTDVNAALGGGAGTGPSGDKPGTQLPVVIGDLGSGVVDVTGKLLNFGAAVDGATKALAG